MLYGTPPQVVDFERNAQDFYLVQRIQDEVHRFAISFHRQLRGKSAIKSKLDDIPGVGEKRRRLLMRHFKSVTAIQEASVEEIAKLGIPAPTAQVILNHLNNPEEVTEEQEEGDEA